jgi:heme exporter protein B
MLRVLASIVQRDLLLACRRRFDVVASLFFFIVVASLFPLGVGPSPDVLRAIAPGILWIAALLASMLALGRLFALDHADGTLEQMLLSSQPLALIVIGKVAAHWLVACLPLVVLAPLLAIEYGMPAGQILVLCLSLLLGTPALSLVGAIGAALTLGVRGSGVLIALVVLPLYAPVLVFGAGAVGAQASGLGAHAHLLLLAGLSAAAAALAPWATAAALRIALE